MTKFCFEDYVFGYADAETEFNMNRKIFEEAFYDPKNIIDKLINGYEFMLIGRKGVGKTAFSAKIRSLSEKDVNLNSDLMVLSNFEFKTFNKLKNLDLEGTQRFKSSWDLTLLIYIYKILNKRFDFSSVKEYQDRIEFLEQNNLLSGKNINNIIRTLSKKSFHFDMKVLKYDHEIELNKGTLSNTEVVEYLFEGLEEIYFNENRLLLMIDGLDDVLRYKKERLDILSGLIRSINEINLSFRRQQIPIKIILLAREDILATITDPDFNKIKRDGGIIINWNAKDDDLKNLVNLRFKLSGVSDENIDKQWNFLFPFKIRNKDSWSYITEFTLNKPRDILQFLTQCQKTYPNKTNLTYSEMDQVLIDYSTEYFIEEMKNELAGFIDDEVINILPQVLQTIGGSDFSYKEFKKVVEKFVSDKPDTYYKKIIFTLFENGYLGEVISIRYWNKKLNRNSIRNQAIFKHKKSNIKINYDYKFSIHKGLYKALNIVKK
ncbi:P-loop ATPase, Sll1717 family [Clostridium sporogenes]|uniref:P-loop ATPase, Sll1717 family n=1 Tax=Clostridium sporogenes TaxID=1509 RepID=UPI00223752A8|nr:hypothetical protein [Clostridium sporogenes]MCW6078214.1 hypothetical protein [Clostridium sporogenes]